MAEIWIQVLPESFFPFRYCTDFAVYNSAPFHKKGDVSKRKTLCSSTNLALVAAITLLILAIGWKTFLLIQLPVLYIATVHGVWLFYVQHQYRHVKWTETEGWDYMTIALNGSSLFKLPALLNWFTGNIGYHHIHHLSPLIPTIILSGAIMKTRSSSRSNQSLSSLPSSHSF